MGRYMISMVLMGGVAACAGCSSTGSMKTPVRPAAVNHVVFIKLKNAADAAELIRDSDRLLATIPGVRSYYAGQHLDTGRGQRVDGNYDVAIYLGFDTRESLDAYVVHENHKAGVEKWQTRWEWIRVHDVLDVTP